MINKGNNNSTDKGEVRGSGKTQAEAEVEADRSWLKNIYRVNCVHTVLSQPTGIPTSDGALRDICAHSLPSRKARTSSPARLVDNMLESGPSVEVRGGDGASWATEPGGGRTGRLCGAAALIGGRDWEYGGGGTDGRGGSQELMGWSRLLAVAVRYGEGDWVVAAREGRFGGEEEVYMGPSGWCCWRDGREYGDCDGMGRLLGRGRLGRRSPSCPGRGRPGLLTGIHDSRRPPAPSMG